MRAMFIVHSYSGMIQMQAIQYVSQQKQICLKISIFLT